jgi:hypothetical protein
MSADLQIRKFESGAVAAILRKGTWGVVAPSVVRTGDETYVPNHMSDVERKLRNECGAVTFRAYFEGDFESRRSKKGLVQARVYVMGSKLIIVSRKGTYEGEIDVAALNTVLTDSKTVQHLMLETHKGNMLNA